MRSEKEIRDLLNQLQSTPAASYFCLKCRKPLNITSSEFDHCWAFEHPILKPSEIPVWVACLKWVLGKSVEQEERKAVSCSKQQVEVSMEKINGKYKITIQINGKEELSEVVDDPLSVIEKIERLIEGNKFWFKR